MRFYLIDKNTYFHFGKVYNFRVAPIFYHNYPDISIFFWQFVLDISSFFFFIHLTEEAPTKLLFKSFIGAIILYHSEMLQRSADSIFLVFRALRDMRILFAGMIVILALNDTTFTFHLRDIEI